MNATWDGVIVNICYEFGCVGKYEFAMNLDVGKVNISK